MDRQVEYTEIAPEASTAIKQMEAVAKRSELEDILVELVYIRVSQLNGCAYCVDRHTREARELGIDERRLAAISAWRESPFFTDRERIALTLTEALTRMACQPVPDAAYQKAHEQFTETELVALVLAIVAMNSWNRLWGSFQTPEIPDL